MRLEQINFIIIGSPKSATTWLQRSLQHDPAIFMPDPELHFFSRRFESGDSWYMSQFSGLSAEHRIIGEKSNSYLKDPAAASRIRTVLPQVKLIAQLRNPVERAYSAYCMLFRRGEVGRDIERYLDPDRPGYLDPDRPGYLDPDRPGQNRFLEGGLYGAQLQRYAALFPMSQLKVVFYEDMRSDPVTYLDEIRRFLELDRHPYEPVVQRVKDKSEPVVHHILRRYLGPLKPMFAPFRHTRAFEAARKLVAKAPDYAQLDDVLREKLVQYYAPDVEHLSSLLGRNMQGWLNSSPPTFPRASGS